MLSFLHPPILQTDYHDIQLLCVKDSQQIANNLTHLGSRFRLLAVVVADDEIV